MRNANMCIMRCKMAFRDFTRWCLVYGGKSVRDGHCIAWALLAGRTGVCALQYCWDTYILNWFINEYTSCRRLFAKSCVLFPPRLPLSCSIHGPEMHDFPSKISPLLKHFKLLDLSDENITCLYTSLSISWSIKFSPPSFFEASSTVESAFS